MLKFLLKPITFYPRNSFRPIVYSTYFYKSDVINTGLGKNQQVFPWRIPLDYYKSERYNISWLLFKENSNTKRDFVNQIDKFVNLGMVTFNEREKVEQIFDNLSKNIQNNSENNFKIFNHKDINLEHLVKKIASDNKFSEINEQYSQLISLITLIIEKILKSNSPNGLDGVTSLMIILNIMNLKLWKSAISYIVSNLDRFENLNALNLVIENIKSIMDKFNFIDESDNTYSRSNLYFDEKELNSIINKEDISKIFTKLDLIAKQSGNSNVFSYDIFCKIVNNSCDISMKFSKVSNISKDLQRTQISAISEIIIQKKENITPKNLVELLGNIILHGKTHEKFIKELTSYIISNKMIFKDHIDPLRMIRYWKESGSYDTEIYEEIIKKKLQEVIDDPNYFRKIPTIVFDLAVIRLKDEELWNLIIKKVQKIDLNKLAVFQKKSLHLAFKIISDTNFVEVNLHDFREQSNHLSKFCMGLKCNKDFTKLHIKSQESQILDCCSEETFKLYKNESEKGNYSIGKNQDQQIVNSIQENFIKGAIKKHFPNFSQMEMTFHDDYSVCCYKIDLAVSIPKIYDKIAIEIVGSPYMLENGKMIGKKQTKFDILEKRDWLIIYLIIGSVIPKQTLGTMNANSEKKVAEICYQLMKSKIKEKNNYELPFVNPSKWMK